ncbi:AEC family transporter [Helicobacter sp. MIT 11-5569]|uniref:AEC family transporter n=1 Tax=Helicobacter sp. MIT 11-5569 TaxID=1548151 RepID=UPI00051FF054|nr:AEC family transporter [Helicobacter sp. MIT 11-5569]TLD80051.1 AEC family transporter [Helicobacter sp. MIT 11-5569]
MFVFNPLWTIFVLLMGGYVAKIIGVLKQKQSRTLLDFAVTFAIPCLIFDGIYHLNLDLSLTLMILTGLMCSLLGGFFAVIVGYFCHFSRATLVSMFLLSSFGNTLFIGIPIVTGIYDASFIGKVVFYDALATALPFSLIAPFVLSLGSNQPISLFANVKRIVIFPPFIALVLGFCAKVVALPDFIFGPIRALGGATTAVALFAIGLGLGFGAIRSAYKPTIIVILCKTLLTPFLFIGILKVFNVEFNPNHILAILECGMPTMALAGAMIIKAKLDSNLAVSSIAFGILFSFVSIPILCYVLL